jgi:hypothetical protein
MSLVSDNQEFTNMSAPAQDITCYMYWSYLDSVMPYCVCFSTLPARPSTQLFLQGPLSGSSDVLAFVGYAVVGPQPSLYAIYVSTSVRWALFGVLLNPAVSTPISRSCVSLSWTSQWVLYADQFYRWGITSHCVRMCRPDIFMFLHSRQIKAPTSRSIPWRSV